MSSHRALWLRTARGRRRIPILFALCVTAGCNEPPNQELSLQVGPDRILRFSPTSGFAQYFEVPGQGDLVRVVLSNYPLRCPVFEPPKPGQVYISITIRAETGQTIIGEKIPWNGIPAEFLPQEDDALPRRSPVTETPKVWALPMIRLFEDARPLPAGGYLTVSDLSREPYGVLEGEFHFSDAGEGEAASAALLGPFRVQFCHTELSPSRGDSDAEPTKKQKEK